MPQPLVGDIEIRKKHQRQLLQAKALEEAQRGKENRLKAYGHLPTALASHGGCAIRAKMRTVPSLFSPAPEKTLAEENGTRSRGRPG